MYDNENNINKQDNDNVQDKNNLQEDYIYEENHNKREDIYVSIPRMERNKKKKRLFRGSFISYVLVILISSFIGGLSSYYVGPKLFSESIPVQDENLLATIMNIQPTDDINTVSAVVKKSIGSVVGITSIETRRYLFSLKDVEGVGSGVIVDSNGYILTNSHVVADGNAKAVEVLFENGDKKTGEVLWYDTKLDLAVIKVDAKGLQAASLGDSELLQVGEIAVAIGNPLGLEFQRTVTSGIISGLHRTIQINSQDQYGNISTNLIENLIQTDASINPGNSGGPLLNSNGEVIGINTAKVKSGEGLGFAIPINEVKLVVEKVIEEGTFKTVYMGVSGIPVEEYQAKLGVELPVEKGLILIQVGEGTPADKAGLLIGDILLEMDDIKIDSITGLKKALYKYKQGDTVSVKVVRNKEELEFNIEFTEMR